MYCNAIVKKTILTYLRELLRFQTAWYFPSSLNQLISNKLSQRDKTSRTRKMVKIAIAGGSGSLSPS